MHQGDACPRCLGGRAIACPECGGLAGRRSLFSHSRLPRTSAGVLSSIDPGAGLPTDGRRKRRRGRVARLLAAVAGTKSAAARGDGKASEDGDDGEDDSDDDDNRRWLGFGAQQTLAD